MTKTWQLKHESDLREERSYDRRFGVGPPVKELWYERRLPGGWVCALLVSEFEGQVVFSEIRVFPDEEKRPAIGLWSGDSKSLPNSSGVTSEVLNEVKWNDIRKDIPQLIEDAESKGSWGLPVWLKSVKRLGISEKALRTPSRIGAKARDEYFKAWVACRYELLAKSGASYRERLRREIRKEFGGKLMLPRTLGVLISRLRPEFIKPTRPGKSGGQATKKARDILQKGRKP